MNEYATNCGASEFFILGEIHFMKVEKEKGKNKLQHFYTHTKTLIYDKNIFSYIFVPL